VKKKERRKRKISSEASVNGIVAIGEKKIDICQHLLYARLSNKTKKVQYIA